MTLRKQLSASGFISLFFSLLDRAWAEESLKAFQASVTGGDQAAAHAKTPHNNNSQYVDILYLTLLFTSRFYHALPSQPFELTKVAGKTLGDVILTARSWGLSGTAKLSWWEQCLLHHVSTAKNMSLSPAIQQKLAYFMRCKFPSYNVWSAGINTILQRPAHEKLPQQAQHALNSAQKNNVHAIFFAPSQPPPPTKHMITKITQQVALEIGAAVKKAVNANENINHSPTTKKEQLVTQLVEDKDVKLAPLLWVEEKWLWMRPAYLRQQQFYIALATYKNLSSISLANSAPPNISQTTSNKELQAINEALLEAITAACATYASWDKLSAQPPLTHFFTQPFLAYVHKLYQPFTQMSYQTLLQRYWQAGRTCHMFLALRSEYEKIAFLFHLILVRTIFLQRKNNTTKKNITPRSKLLPPSIRCLYITKNAHKALHRGQLFENLLTVWKVLHSALGNYFSTALTTLTFNEVLYETHWAGGDLVAWMTNAATAEFPLVFMLDGYSDQDAAAIISLQQRFKAYAVQFIFLTALTDNDHEHLQSSMVNRYALTRYMQSQLLVETAQPPKLANGAHATDKTSKLSLVECKNYLETLIIYRELSARRQLFTQKAKLSKQYSTILTSWEEKLWALASQQLTRAQQKRLDQVKQPSTPYQQHCYYFYHSLRANKEKLRHKTPAVIIHTYAGEEELFELIWTTLVPHWQVQQQNISNIWERIQTNNTIRARKPNQATSMAQKTAANGYSLAPLANCYSDTILLTPFSRGDWGIHALNAWIELRLLETYKSKPLFPVLATQRSQAWSSYVGKPVTTSLPWKSGLLPANVHGVVLPTTNKASGYELWWKDERYWTYSPADEGTTTSAQSETSLASHHSLMAARRVAVNELKNSWGLGEFLRSAYVESFAAAERATCFTFWHVIGAIIATAPNKAYPRALFSHKILSENEFLTPHDLLRLFALTEQQLYLYMNEDDFMRIMTSPLPVMPLALLALGEDG